MTIGGKVQGIVGATQVVVGPSTLMYVIVTGTGATPTVSIYDHASAATGTPIVLKVPDTNSSECFVFECEMSQGIHVVPTNANVTVVYA